jgi:hypothetical protein
MTANGGDLARRFFDAKRIEDRTLMLDSWEAGKPFSLWTAPMAYRPIPPTAIGWPGFAFPTCTVQFPSGPFRQPPGEFENLLPELRWNPRPNLDELLQISVI